MRLDQAHFTYERRREICIYRLFVQLLLKEFPIGLKNNASFVLRDILFTLLRIMSKPCKKRKVGIDNHFGNVGKFKINGMTITIV